MDKHQKAGHARNILHDIVFNECMDQLEQSAIIQGMNAAGPDHEARQAAMAELRAVRNIRSKLRALVEEAEANRPDRDVA